MYRADGLLYALEKWLQGVHITFIKTYKDMGTWRLLHKISEKTCRDDYHPPQYEAVTVYACERVDGEDAGHQAIMKIRAEYAHLGGPKTRCSY
jgi:hypothetical protein